MKIKLHNCAKNAISINFILKMQLVVFIDFLVNYDPDISL